MRYLREPQEQRFDYPTHQIVRQEMVEAAPAAATTPAAPARTLSCRLPLRRGSSKACRPRQRFAQVLVFKYTDHLPLYCQAQIWARQGINRSFNPHRLGRPRRLASTSGARAAARQVEVLVKTIRRSDHRAGARSRLRQDEDGPALGYVRDDRPLEGNDRPGFAYVYARTERPRKSHASTRGSSRPPHMRRNSLFLFLLAIGRLLKNKSLRHYHPR